MLLCLARIKAGVADIAASNFSVFNQLMGFVAGRRAGVAWFVRLNQLTLLFLTIMNRQLCSVSDPRFRNPLNAACNQSSPQSVSFIIRSCLAND